MNKFNKDADRVFILNSYENRGILHGGLRLMGASSATKTTSQLITIITVVLNGESFIGETIETIKNQKYKDFEYLVIDGGSTDKTVEILQSHNDFIDYWISEKDFGIADAFNKGVRLSRGKYLNFQGDGDGFISENSLQTVAELLSDGHEIHSFQVSRVSENGAALYSSKKPKKLSKYKMLSRMPCPHQGLFTSIKSFESAGLFDSNYKFSMDYDLLLRQWSNGARIKCHDQVVAFWRDDGIGKGKTKLVLTEHAIIRRQNCSWTLSVIIGLVVSVKYYSRQMLTRMRILASNSHI